MNEQLAAVTEQQQHHADIFDMKLAKLLEIVKTGSVDQDEAARSFISGEIVKMMPRKLTTKELQKIEAHRIEGSYLIDLLSLSLCTYSSTCSNSFWTYRISCK